LLERTGARMRKPEYWEVASGMVVAEGEEAWDLAPVTLAMEPASLDIFMNLKKSLRVRIS